MPTPTPKPSLPERFKPSGSSFGDRCWALVNLICLLLTAYTLFTLLPAIGAVLAVLTWRKYDLKTSDVELMARFNNGEIDLENCEARLSHPYPRTAK